jgi:hypothetical protein
MVYKTKFKKYLISKSVGDDGDEDVDDPMARMHMKAIYLLNRENKD